MAYHVTFRGQSLQEVQRAAAEYVKTVPEMRVIKAFAKQDEEEAFCTISLEKKEPKE